jgi:DNA-binding FadR family transcriptional regulator
MDSFTHNLLVEGMDLDELYEIRQALERAFIEKAAVRIGEDDLADATVDALGRFLRRNRPAESSAGRRD